MQLMLCYSCAAPELGTKNFVLVATREGKKAPGAPAPLATLEAGLRKWKQVYLYRRSMYHYDFIHTNEQMDRPSGTGFPRHQQNVRCHVPLASLDTPRHHTHTNSFFLFCVGRPTRSSSNSNGSMKGVVWVVSLLEWQLLIHALDLPFGRRRHAHRQNVRPALASNQFLKNSMRSSKNDVKQQQQQQQVGSQYHHDEDIEVLFRHQDDESIHDDKVTSAIAAKNGWAIGDDEDIEVLFQDDEKDDIVAVTEDDEEEDEEDQVMPPLDAMERAWRHCKKPLLRVGSKGIQFTHGNSLRQLLEAHQVVKVKVNTKRFGMYHEKHIVVLNAFMRSFRLTTYYVAPSFDSLTL